MISVVYLAHGPKRLSQMAAFSALTLAAAAKEATTPWRLVVYTDRPSVFAACGIECDTPPLERLGASVTDYPHRLKMLALRDCARHYDGDILYLDGDTYFTSSPQAVFDAVSETTSVMHTSEYTLPDRLPELWRVLHEGRFESPILAAAADRDEILMWNAGTIGIAWANTRLVEDVLAASDELYRAYSYRLVEQISWSLGLSEATTLMSAHDVIAHYWWGREQVTHEVTTLLRRHRGLGHDELAQKAFALQPVGDEAWRPPLGRRVRNRAMRVRRAAANPRGLVPRRSGGPLTGPALDHALERARR